MNRLYAIAINTFREAVRDRVLLGVLGAAIAVLLFTLALGQLSLNQEQRVVGDVGLASISLFAIVMAVFLGSSLLYKEIERKTLYVILPKPIHRGEFLVGKYLGIALTAAVFVVLMGAVHVWVAAIQAGAPVWMTGLLPVVLGAGFGLNLWRAKDKTAVILPWSALALVLALGVATQAHRPLELATTIASLVLVLGEVLIVAAVAMFFSSFSTPFLTGALTLGVWLIGRSADELITMRSSMLTEGVKASLRALAEVAPNLFLFTPARHTLETYSAEFGGPFTYVATSMGYAVVYSALVLLFAVLIFRRRDFL